MMNGLRKRKYLQKKEDALSDTRSDKDNIILKPVVQLDKTKTKKKLVQEANTKKHKYQCTQCDFMGKNQVALNKHMNMKHNEVKTPQETKKNIGDFKFSLCEDKFSEIND